MVMPWPTRATTPAPCKPTSATAIFSIRSGTPSYHQTRFKDFWRDVVVAIGRYLRYAEDMQAV